MHGANKGPEQVPTTVTEQDGSIALVYAEMSWGDATYLMDGLSTIRPVHDTVMPQRQAVYGYITNLPRTERVWKVAGVRGTTYAETNLTLNLEDASYEQPLRAWVGESLIALYESREQTERKLFDARIEQPLEPKP